MLNDIDGTLSAALDHIGLAIKRVTQAQNHCGIIYRDPNSQIWLLHLAWNFDLRGEPPTTHYQWVQTPLSTSNQKFLATICERVRVTDPPIPYGLDHHGIGIDPETGQLLPYTEGKGLTCASFILAIFQCYGMPLLLEDEWPKGANREWQESIIRGLKEDGAPPEQIAAVESDVGTRRFAPQEVVAASTSLPWPVSLGRTLQLTCKLLDELRSAA